MENSRDMPPFERLFRSMPCFLTVQDKDFRIIEANDWFVREFGDYADRYCYQVYKRRPEKCERCPVEKTFRDGRGHDSEELVTTLGGREVSVLVNTTPIRDERGEIIAVMEMSTDITELKSLHNQLRVSQERYRQLFEEVPCFISIQDKSLRIIEANRLHRNAFGNFYGEKCYKIYKHRQRECNPCVVRETFESGKPHTSEEVVTSQDGSQMNVLVVTAPLRNHKGEIESVIEMSADITQIRLLENKLTQTGLLIGSISHSIRGILNGLDGGIYLVNKGLEKDNRERIKQGWEIAQRNIERIRSMALDILYYAKDREMNWTIIDIAALVAELKNIVEPKAGEYGVAFVSEIAENIGGFEADHKAIRSLFINILENSIDACRVDKTKDSHRIILAVSRNHEFIDFKISDNGIGMDQETREKAFSIFFSGKGAEGTGLGLFIANKIAQQHGGNIQIESELNLGTSMIVRLPRQRKTESQTADSR
jgi:PAS domain S-box-containing protein